MSEEIVEIVVITPEMATQMLRRNTRNRKLREEHVRDLAGKMARGEFQFNGDAIRWSRQREILDGQHRLHAVARSGVSIRAVVVHGLTSDSQVTMDRQNRRTLGHHLDIMGESNTRTLTATLNLAVQWDRGVRSKLGTSAHRVPSYEEAYDYLTHNPGIRASLDAGKQLASRKIMRAATGAFLHWVFSRINVDATEDFFDRLISGMHVDEDDPVWALRERSKDLRTGKMESPATLVPLACKAWNLYRRGKGVRFLRFRTSGDCPETFPEPR
ncbi:hypothetical protein [Actinocrispum wychmicini]|uniref:ParB-like nuclease family protein n=1 Tax=Actinocrispum wychmicini TaxID=1213861 RepID=A0A4R2ISB6_9PSEU|nr:hypothetical protein [Actinocrispum wychmicini]TCO47326.1 hypothetical protein EV192_11766 [Actinocrispum wychmicini]